MSSDAQAAFLTPAEVATLLRCNRGTVYARIANGSIPAVRLDERSPLLVPRYELERRLYERRTTP